VKYVLIAEDDPDVARVVVEGIGDRLYVATHVVPNGALVPEVIATRRPDLIVLDVALPGLSGLDVFDLVRSDPSYAGVPVLFLTASPEKAETAFAPAGAQRVMAKPFELDELVTVVDEMLDGRHAGIAAPAESAA
jgi:CheY-like chemotaxis protein